jgi:transcriptional regulator with XRE-family HTH domain
MTLQGVNKMELGDIVRKLRLQRNMTIRDLADKTNLSYAYISQIENGKRTPTVETLNKLADALGVTVQYLIGAPKAEEIVREDRLFLDMIKSTPAMKAIWDQIKDLSEDRQAEVARVIRLWRASNNI